MGASFGSATFPHAYYYSTNYSFGLNGSEVMGYSTMWYTKYAIGPLGLEGETDHLSRAAFDMLVPDLFVVDSGTGQWMRARDTCPLPYWKVDASLREYTVAVCDWAPGDGPSELRLFFHVAPNAVATWGSSGVSMLTAYATWYPATVSVLANATLSHDLDHGTLGAYMWQVGENATWSPTISDPTAAITPVMFEASTALLGEHKLTLTVLDEHLEPGTTHLTITVGECPAGERSLDGLTCV